LNLNKTQTKQAHPDMTSRMTMISERIAVLKRPQNFFFLAFCGVIYKKIITQTGLHCSKQLETYFFINFVKNCCISPLNNACARFLCKNCVFTSD